MFFNYYFLSRNSLSHQEGVRLFIAGCCFFATTLVDQSQPQTGANMAGWQCIRAAAADSGIILFAETPLFGALSHSSTFTVRGLTAVSNILYYIILYFIFFSFSGANQ